VENLAVIGEVVREGVHGNPCSGGEERRNDVQGVSVQLLAASEESLGGEVAVKVALEATGRGM
jgi:hypothetical protein